MAQQEVQQSLDGRVEKLWSTLDTRKAGYLDLKGLKKGLYKMDHPLKNADGLLRDVMKAVDTTGNGVIEYHEFHHFVQQTEQELLRLFKSIDHDHNGHIDKEELCSAFANAGLVIPKTKLDQFFAEVDKNKDGVITFDEWRDFLLFIPTSTPNLGAVFSYYSSTLTVNLEGDVHVNATTGNLGYFLAGGIAGVVSRTATAPLDRLKVYLIAQTTTRTASVDAIKSGAPVKAASKATRPLIEAVKDLWRAGGIRSLFAGNGLNVVKVMPESAIKFGAYEASKRALANLEGHGDPKRLSPSSQFLAGGLGGMAAQCCVYPLDTLKFRMQCETVKGGPHGNSLIALTARRMWQTSGFRAYYRGLAMGLAGMFPYAAVDLATFEYLKRSLSVRHARALGVHETDESATPSNFETGVIGAFSGALSASIVYPMNLLRTRLQAQGTAIHPPTYTGIWDVTVKTVQKEGFRGLFRGITPNLLKVAPAVGITYITYENSKKLLGLK